MFKKLFKSNAEKRKNEANEFFKKQQKKQKEEEEKEEKEINWNKKSIKGRILYNSEQKLKSYNRELSFTPQLSQEKKKELYKDKKKELNEEAKQKIKEELEKFNSNLKEKKEKLVKREEYLLENTKNSGIISANRLNNQRKYQEQKMNINKNYILTKLESNNYGLLSSLINSLFDTKLSEPSKEKFQEYLLENPSKKEDIMKILKSVYRLKYNKSIENKKEEIIKKAKKLKDNRNQFLAEIKGISSHIDLATGFHDFTGIEYYICNKGQVEKLNDNKNINEISLERIIGLSPIFYANGICSINPIIQEYTSDRESISNSLEKVQNKNFNGIKMSKLSKENKNNPNIIDIDKCIKNIKTFNTKDSLLSKFFEQKILGKATDE